jgi:adenylate cyclase
MAPDPMPLIKPLTIRVYDGEQLVYAAEASGPVELGRQSTISEELYNQVQDSNPVRFVIANIHEDTVSRKHLRMELVAHGRVRLTNLSDRRRVYLANGSILQPNESCELILPANFALGIKTIRIEESNQEEPQLQSLPQETQPPGSYAARGLHDVNIPLTEDVEIKGEAVVGWLQTTLGLLHSAATSAAFFTQAAEAVVELVGLDSGRVLLWQDNQWAVKAVHSRRNNMRHDNWQPSRQVLDKVRQQKKTLWQVPHGLDGSSGSLLSLAAVVGAPILNCRGEVIGALYGDRLVDSSSALAGPITRLHALLVELLANCIAAGLARLEQEQAAVSARIRFEQFFTPELARNLVEQPDLLQPRDANVTILFSDIRGYSRISERLGSAATVAWMCEVFEVLSDCVLRQRGVLVDYIGDELMAMWGAPEKQEDHAARACRAAIDMLEHLPEMNARWEEKIGEPLRLGIGINSGTASVGNIGSHRKFKYGAQGYTVNMASRVQGATKFLKTNLILTEPTRAQLDESFLCRRLGRVRVVNIMQPVQIYELVPRGQLNWAHLQTTYEQALEDFERKDFRRAARALGNLVIEYPTDGPSLVLLSRAVNALVEEPRELDAVWDLPGK